MGLSTILQDTQGSRLTQLMDVAALKSRVHAANLANQNTPGYKARAVDFDAAFQEALATDGDTSDIQPSVYEPADLSLDNDGNNVSTERETLSQAQNQTLYNAYLALMQGKKKLIATAISPAP